MMEVFALTQECYSFDLRRSANISISCFMTSFCFPAAEKFEYVLKIIPYLFKASDQSAARRNALRYIAAECVEQSKGKYVWEVWKQWKHF